MPQLGHPKNRLAGYLNTFSDGSLQLCRPHTVLTGLLSIARKKQEFIRKLNIRIAKVVILHLCYFAL
jgi:hypothetical protein